MMVMASQEMLDLYSREKQITSDFFNVFHFENLNAGLTEAEARELVQKKDSLGKGLTADVQEIALKWGKFEPFLLQLAGRTLWEMQRHSRSQKWAQAEFKKQASRFKFQPKSPLFNFLFRVVAKIGKISAWFVKNRNDLKDFYAGLFVIGVVMGVTLLFVFGFISWEQIVFLKDHKSGE